MELVESVNLNEFDHLLTYENWVANTVPFRIWIEGNTGEVRVYDPSDPGLYYYVFLPARNLRGNWISLRTNGLSISFGEEF